MSTAPPVASDLTRPGTTNEDIALDIRGLSKTFRTSLLAGGGNQVRALDQVDLQVHRGEIVALVGESGSGKSTIARLVTGLEKPTDGSIHVGGKPLTGRFTRADRHRVQMVFQDPFGSLNPAHPVSYTIERPLRIHQGGLTAGQREERLLELLGTVGLEESMLDSYPHQLSGGQRQRVAIARALAVEPDLLLADEPTSMLDVSVRIGILNLMRKLRDERGLGMLYITHDLAAARYVADRVAVIYGGRIMEADESLALLDEPAHPYTELLLSAMPDPSRRDLSTAAVGRQDATQIVVGEGCPFAARCPQALPHCADVRPATTPRPGTGTGSVACHLIDPETLTTTRPSGAVA